MSSNKTLDQTSRESNAKCWDSHCSERFLNALAGQTAQFTFQLFHDKDKAAHNVAEIIHGNLMDTAPNCGNTARSLEDYLADKNRQGYGVFMMVNQGDGKGRRRENVTEVRAVFLDLDGAPLEPVRTAPLSPHIIVETSPGKYHVYWKIKELPLAYFSAVQRELAERFCGDPKVCDLPRVMRLPGFDHNKAEPFKVRIIEENDSPMYLAEEFLAAFEIDPTDSEEKRRPYPPDERGSDIIYRGERNDSLMRLAGAMRRKGAPKETIAAALRTMNGESCSPPLSTDEVEAIATSVVRYEPAPASFDLTDLGNGQRFVLRHGRDVLFCERLGGWMVWEGSRWRRDDTGEVDRRAKQTVRMIPQEASREKEEDRRTKILKHARGSQMMVRVEAMIRAAQTEPGISVRPEDFDADKFLLNVRNGTIDLRTGELREHRREDFVTRICPVDYDAEAPCPNWEKFLLDIMSGNSDLIEFMHKALGYALTGDTSEQCWFFLYGTGANGKSTLTNTILYIMGDYAAQARPDTFLVHRNEGPRNDLAALRGARFISVSEPSARKGFDEATIKSFTGGDKITCRFLFREDFSYRPQGKLFFSANHRPSVEGADHGFWRRIREIPFRVRIEDGKQDKSLGGKLRKEASGILAWLVRGCQHWLNGGLNVPESVSETTKDYQDEMDPVADFLNSPFLVIGQDRTISIIELHRLYVEYCAENKVEPLSQNRFTRALKSKSFEQRRLGRRKVRCWLGVGQRNDVTQITGGENNSK